jgi:hypothetical protein
MADAYVRGDQARLRPSQVTTEFKHLLTPDRRPTLVTSTGQCPRCRHETYQADPLYEIRNFNQENLSVYQDTALSMLRTGLLAEKTEFRQTMRCVCGEEHPGREADERGCGAIWNLDVSW